MIEYNIETVKVQVPTKITCDMCDEEIKTDLELQEMLNIDFIGGYNSVFGDGTHVKADLCQHCLYELIQGFYRVEEIV